MTKEEAFILWEKFSNSKKTYCREYKEAFTGIKAYSQTTNSDIADERWMKLRIGTSWYQLEWPKNSLVITKQEAETLLEMYFIKIELDKTDFFKTMMDYL